MRMMGNPFSLNFGQPPIQSIDRPVQREEILSAFLSDTNGQMTFIITGVRGSGKTVLMTQIANRLRTEEDWIVVECNAETDLLKDLVSRLYSNPVCYPWFQKAKINLSFLGLGVTYDQHPPVLDYGTAATKMIESIKNHGKRLLISIDEATNSPQLRTFAAEYQIWLRQGLPVYLLMTGLYENIYQLQNEKSLTFLYRAPKIHLKPLNIGTIQSRYRALFHLSPEDALKMAQLTRGYPYAFQVLGYYSWENNKNYQQALEAYQQHLDEYVYEKIWSELSRKDRQVILAIAQSDRSVKSIRTILDMTDNQFSPYRERLLRKGIIEATGYGMLDFTLPFFPEYAQARQFTV